MKKSIYIYLTIVLFVTMLSACEDLIDIDLNSADPRIVIVADLYNDPSNSSIQHLIYVSRTVPFDDQRKNEVITDATVAVQTSTGKTYSFIYSDSLEGYTITDEVLTLEEGMMYTLHVQVDGQLYIARESMPPYVEVDSTGVLRETIFDEDYYFATFKFQDPADTDNYYKYSVSVDGKPMKFYAVFKDKFNDGLYITHQIGSTDNDISRTSSAVVRRQTISPAVYRYWNDIQSTNPGSAAPMNPTSNISNGALGYFSVSNANNYTFEFLGLDEEDEDD